MKTATRKDPPTARSRRTRQRIQKEALELFRRRGFEATTMREIARRAGLSPGLAYYYFESKDDIVMAFYEDSHQELLAALPEILAGHKDLRSRLRAVLTLRLRTFQPHRRFLGVLYREAVDPASALSPFAARTARLRAEAVDMFDQLITQRDASAEVRPHLARVFWLYMLGILLFWIFDESPGQTRTERLLDLSLDLIFRVLRLERLPVARSLVRAAVRLLAEFSPTVPTPA